MNRVQRGESVRAPLIEGLLEPIERFARRESSGGIVLLLCTGVALVWANSPWATSYHDMWNTAVSVGAGGWRATTTLHAIVNDGFMAVFFLLVGLEIKRELLVGELASRRKATLPMAGAIGGMLVPAAIYGAFNAGHSGAAGWGISMATDIAFALGVLALLGDRVPPSLRVFLVALAIADDIGAVLVIAIFYSGSVATTPLLAAALLFGAALAANRVGVRRPLVYALIGIALWYAVLLSGIHATIAGVLLAFAIPSRTRIHESAFLAAGRRALDDFDAALPDAPQDAPAVLTNDRSAEATLRLEGLIEQVQPPLHRLVNQLHASVAYGIMPLFALANAGVAFPADPAVAFGSRVSLGIIVGLVIGKPLGITLLAWLSVRAGFAEAPSGVQWRQLFAVACVGGIGFTMSLFVGGLAFDPTALHGSGTSLLDQAKLGILAASLLAGIAGWLTLRAVGHPNVTPQVSGDASAASS